MPSLLKIAIRLGLAVVLGGLIGYERENTQRPAGFRTHILVCVGAALVMVTSEYIFAQYRGIVNLDPARLGAQVISGIGFLGAGTIIRDGVNVKGLTTAASLWTVSCVGIAVGAGLYSGAVVATIISYITLLALKKFENIIFKTNSSRTIFVQVDGRPGWLDDISAILAQNNAHVKSIEFENNKSQENAFTRLTVRFPDDAAGIDVIRELQKMPGIIKAYLK